MTASIELQVISRILTSDDEHETTELCTFDASYYTVFKDQIQFILDHQSKYGNVPDLVVSGFHLMKKTEYSDSEIEEIKAMANELMDYPTKFVTCHCTGTAAFSVMKSIMGDGLEYVHSGEEVTLSNTG